MLRSACKGLLSLLLAGTLMAAPLAQEADSPPTGPLKTSTIEGLALDAAGSPLSGITVHVAPIEDPSAQTSAVTDVKGEFLIDGLVFGYYRISFDYGGGAYPSNRVVLVPPGKTIETEFRLGAIEPQDEALGLEPGATDALVGAPIGGVARLSEDLGPRGFAWFRTGRGVAVLIGGGALLVGGLIALTDNSDEPITASESEP